MRLSVGGTVRALAAGLGLLAFNIQAMAGRNVLLTEVPDYTWHAGCFGTASGNLMGYWDRHGFPNFYTGPTAGGLAPLNSDGPNEGIRSMWASRADFDGRPPGKYGHWDDYWVIYESTAPDPYIAAGRPEHSPDCIGDFIGLSQNKWTNLNGECDGNIDAFSFVFWDQNGDRRVNHDLPSASGDIIPDIPSGLQAWTRFRGYASESFSQLTDFNPTVSVGHGFTFSELQAEIDAGYPVLLFLQSYNQLSRSLPGMPRANPEMHGMLAYGYYVSDEGDQFVRYKTSWGSSGDQTLSRWNGQVWQARLPVRGVIGYHPLPQITNVFRSDGVVTVEWAGPSSVLSNVVSRTSTPLHSYVLQRATRLNPPDFENASAATTQHRATLPDCCPDQAAFYRIKLLTADLSIEP